MAIVRRRQDWIPRNEKVELKIDAIIHRSDDSVLDGSLVNMSFEGCEITAVGTFDVGERVRIQIDGQGFIEAEVRWFSEGRVGAAFLCECHV